LAITAGYHCKFSVLNIEEPGEAVSGGTDHICFSFCVATFWTMILCWLHGFEVKLLSCLVDNQ
jgi:hypothetical protein